MNRIVLSAGLSIALAGTAMADSDAYLNARRKLQDSRRAGAAAVVAKDGHKAGPTAAALPKAMGTASAYRSADSSKENFHIGIEFRGPIKKTDNNIGTASMRCKTTGPDTFEVELNGNAVIPKKKKSEPLEFNILRQFKISGSTISVTGGKEHFSSSAEKYKAKILNMLALAYLIKFRSPIYGDGQAAPTTYDMDGKKYQFTFNKVGKKGAVHEVQVQLNDLTENNRNLGKFFLEPAPAAPSPFRKFRIQTKEKLGINFFTI